MSTHEAATADTQRSSAGLANPDALFQNAIFRGDFLDTGYASCEHDLLQNSNKLLSSTVVFGVFLAFGTFLFALIRAYAPKLTLMSVFGTIAIDIFPGLLAAPAGVAHTPQGLSLVSRVRNVSATCTEGKKSTLRLQSRTLEGSHWHSAAACAGSPKKRKKEQKKWDMQVHGVSNMEA